MVKNSALETFNTERKFKTIHTCSSVVTIFSRLCSIHGSSLFSVSFRIVIGFFCLFFRTPPLNTAVKIKQKFEGENLNKLPDIELVEVLACLKRDLLCTIAE